MEHPYVDLFILFRFRQTLVLEGIYFFIEIHMTI